MNIEGFALHAVDLPVPYLAQGRDFEGWDCWGLVHCAFDRVHGIRLDSWEDDYNDGDLTGIDEIIRGEMVERWRESNGRPGEVALIRTGRRWCHVALVLGRGRMLHVERKIATCIERYDSGLWRHRIVGTYRYVG